MPAMSDAYVSVMLIQKPGPRPTSTAALPCPSSRRSPQNKWCEASVHASTSRPAATAPIAPTTRRVTSASRATKSRMNPAHATGIISTPRYFTFSASIFASAPTALSSQA